MANIMDISDFIAEITELAKQRGFEIKQDRGGVTLWPTYDAKTGGLGEWFCMYIRAVKESKNV